jgi:hypothetical protein
MRPFARSLIAALVLHGALVILAGHVAVRRPEPAPPAAPLEVEVEPADPEPPLAASPARAPSAVAAPLEHAEGASRVAVAEPRTGATAPAEAGHAAASSEAWSAPVMGPLSLDSLGVGRANPFLVPQRTREADPAREAARRVEQSMGQAALTHDREIGLGPDGPVVAELESATAHGATPPNGRAVFRAVVGADGQLEQLALVDTSEDARSWEEVLRAASAGLAGRRMRKVPGARSVAMTIEVVARWQLPSGHDPGADVRVGGVRVKRGEGKRSPRVDVLNPIPKLTTTPLTIGSTTVQIPTIQLTIFETDADPTDVGARPLRTVQARVVDAKIE